MPYWGGEFEGDVGLGAEGQAQFALGRFVGGAQ